MIAPQHQTSEKCFPQHHLFLNFTSTVNRGSAGSFSLLVLWLQGGCGPSVLWFSLSHHCDHCWHEMGSWGLLWSKISFLRAFIPLVVELPSCHSLSMSALLFQEHTSSCHYCAAACQRGGAEVTGNNVLGFAGRLQDLLETMRQSQKQFQIKTWSIPVPMSGSFKIYPSTNHITFLTV